MTDEEKADRWFEEHSEDSPSAVVKALAALLRDVREEEREACAREAQAVAERVPEAERPTKRTVTAMFIASRIRARGSM